MGDFTFWISLSLSPKYGLRPKISERLSQFLSLDSAIAESKVWSQRFAETKLSTQRLLSPKLIWTNQTQSYWIYMQEIA